MVTPIWLKKSRRARQFLWDAWDRTDVSNRDRFGWLGQIAGALDRLHFAGEIVESLRPEMIVVSPNGVAILADFGELLPLPLPDDVPLRGGFSTAPELLLNPTESDARADLFAFGALLYALLLGRELSDLDFTLTGTPKHFLERVPDANPFVVRLLARTFVRDPSERFPTADGALIDPTGFHELIAALGACRRNLDRVKIDVAAWSTVGMVRSGNEDGVTIFHTGDGRLDDSDEAALIVLADGMGGMASGEVAAAMTLHALRQELLSGPPFSAGMPVTPLPSTPSELADGDASRRAMTTPRSRFRLLRLRSRSSRSTRSRRNERSRLMRSITVALREANRARLRRVSSQSRRRRNGMHRRGRPY